MNTIENLTLDAERALYGIRDTRVKNCTFSGPADGESALKECRNIAVEDCLFHLRYPLWHVEGAQVRRIAMTDTCRAAFWYDRDLSVFDSTLGGIKAFREMDNCALTGCTIDSKEFGWFCRGLTVRNTKLTSEYPFFQCRDMDIDGLQMQAKYSFQYCENVTIRNSVLDTKDAFWHAKNVTVYDSVIKGEYLAWYSENVRLIRCKLIGTQPLCYCRGLVLENCTMEGCDLSFENSEVTATVRGSIDSVKNPVRGSIRADAIGEVILDEYKWPGDCQIDT
jgi:hypothetical protein